MTGPADTTTEPEVWHFIADVDGMRAYSKMTATRDDGTITRTDSRDPWEPIDVNGEPTWFRVSEAVADAYMADDDEDAS